MKQRDSNRMVMATFYSRHRLVALLATWAVLFAGAAGAQNVKDNPGPADGTPPSHEEEASMDSVDQQPSLAVLTHHNDNYRTGAYLRETELTPALVDRYKMRLKYSRSVNGSINGQLLYVPGLFINGAEHDVLYAATSSNSVHAVDAHSGEPLWSKTYTDPETNSRTVSNGIGSTPVIDLESNTMYLVYSTKTRNPRSGENCERPDLNVTYWLLAIDIRTGDRLRYVKVEASVLRSDGTTLSFFGTNHLNRSALLLSKGHIYVSFGMRFQEECIESHGWIMRYDAQTLEPKGVFCTAPNVRGTIWGTPTSGGGAGIWQGGGGPTADRDGNVYFITGNGNLDYPNQTYGDSIIKLKPDGDALEYAASFPPNELRYRKIWDRLRRNDVDLGSGGSMIIPETRHVMGGGKTGIWYLLDRETMTSVQEFSAFTNRANPSLRDQGWDVGPRLHGTPTYWRGPEEDFAYVYQWSDKDHLKAYRYYFRTGRFDENQPLVDNHTCPNNSGPGGQLSLSANGTNPDTGIIWAMFARTYTIIRHECDPSERSQSPDRLLAFDAETLRLLWETDLPARSHFMPPTVAGGKVFVPASNQIRAYELNR